ncbi:hypothetical protein PJW08_14795 [Tenacibaculum finnmarkense]|nr:hypothetical protein PJW08_14795 [Tenacibaculum finnmarkense]
MKKAVILFNILIFSLFCNVQLHAQQNEFIVAENYFRNNDYQKAVHLYKKLHNKSPYNSLYLKRLVTDYQETNQFLVADALLSERIKEKPNLVFLNIIKGYNFERQQKDIQANKEYQIALNSLDKKRNYGATIARLFKEYNKLDFAIEAYTKIITNNPKANYGFQLAQLYGEKGNFKKMFDSYVSLVDKDEKYLNNVKRYTE